jgi:uncharacterized protein
VTGGSRAYVLKLIAPFADRIRLNTEVTRVLRTDLGVMVTDAGGRTDRFDQVIFASHSDETLAMLGDATEGEQAVLSAIRYRDNDVWLHCDKALMPRRSAAWTAWNVLSNADRNAELTLTYWMNALQGIDRATPVFVTLNPPVPPQDSLTFGRYSYAHPQYDSAALAAQARLPEIQGAHRSWFAGAWTGYGFHEDGLRSGLAAAEALGASIPWRQSAMALAEAAE